MGDRDYPSLVAEVMGYFDGRPPQECVTCGVRPEARPGARLYVTCLRIAAICYEAIKREGEVDRETKASAAPSLDAARDDDAASFDSDLERERHG